MQKFYMYLILLFTFGVSNQVLHAFRTSAGNSEPPNKRCVRSSETRCKSVKDAIYFP